MTNKIVKTLGVTLLCFLTSATFAGAALDEINVAVAAKAGQIDDKFGVLLTTTERDNLKIALIVKEITANDSEQTVQQQTANAIATYEIVDPVEQRKLLIEIEASLVGGGGGSSPPCCRG